jgi:hypothetical protein
MKKRRYKSEGLLPEILVDDCDRTRVEALPAWFLCANGYVRTNRWVAPGKKRYISLHRYILNPPTGVPVDHINGNKLDNRRANLRLASNGLNNQNISRNKRNKSGYRGVSYAQANRAWRAEVSLKGQDHYLGYYTDKLFAAAVASTWRTLFMPGANS